ncbi:MAG: aromatic ring-hydroxylating dioxygenase subunit alpha [Bacteroidota bacterium]
MNASPYYIHPDISEAHTLPADFYRSGPLFEQIKEQVFAKAWHCIGMQSILPETNSVQPFPLLEGFLNEPLLLTRDQAGELACLSNVCTHRGNLLALQAGRCQELRCRYHGRRFGLDGQFKSMPEFQEAKNFPSQEDHLPKLPLESLGELLFSSLDPAFPFSEWMQPVLDRVNWMPLDEFTHLPEHSRTYEVKAHWALYVDNYLEGFHIPFVHPGLNQVINYKEYGYELFPYGNLQLGIAREGEASFELPSDHPDAGKQIAAYYFWLFPNLMLNFYPWGLSLNLVEPLSLHQTRIRFESFVWRPDLYDDAQRDLLHLTELEDEAIVESVHQGVQSRLYRRGRFSPKMEVAVHQFHQLLGKGLQAS